MSILGTLEDLIVQRNGELAMRVEQSGNMVPGIITATEEEIAPDSIKTFDLSAFVSGCSAIRVSFRFRSGANERPDRILLTYKRNTSHRIFLQLPDEDDYGNLLSDTSNIYYIKEMSLFDDVVELWLANDDDEDAKNVRWMNVAAVK